MTATRRPASRSGPRRADRPADPDATRRDGADLTTVSRVAADADADADESASR